jgi:cytosine/adenosine deaminase-related metal-dependent hydrolase
MWQVMRGAIDVQKARSAYEPNLRPLRPTEALYLGTRGGARALGKDDTIGTLDVGKEADLLLVDINALLPYGRSQQPTEELSTDDVVALCIYRGGPGAIVESYVRGRSVYKAGNT